MPVNTATLKTFAPAMRRQLMEAVGRKLDLLLHSQTPDTLSTYARQIAELCEQEAENREQLLERVAYTWFNRLCALRYLDAKGWHPFGCKVLMPAAEGETQSELLKLMRAGSLPAELKPHTNEARLHGLLDGQIPPAIAGADPQGEVYRELVLASCRSYHQLLPDLFEGLDDASELLLPDDLLSEGSIAGGFRSAISEEDCEDVEIIGWLYQFYISEKKDQVIGKVVKSEDIPAATQLFTPNWIVKYMVQNSLGATWLATYPDSPLKGQMEFYIEPAEQTSEVQAQLGEITPESLDPEALTLIDPACGSGHILVEAYDLLKAIYLDRGYRQRDIPELILTKNLYGLDICPRAAQLAAFSLLMKGREDDRRLLERDIQLNVMPLQDSTGLNVERLAASIDLAAAGVSCAEVTMMAELFAHATTLGSLLQVPMLLTEKLPSLSHLAERPSQDLLASADIKLLGALTRQAVILAQMYDVVVANPPYMGGKFMNQLIKQYCKDRFPDSKTDLFAASAKRYLGLGKATGFTAVMTPFTWMSLGSYSDFRSSIISSRTISSLVKPEYHAFFDSAFVPVCSFVLRNHHIRGFRSIFIDLSDFYGADIQASKTIEAIKTPGCKWRHTAKQDDFKSISGCPIAYWISIELRSIFERGVPLARLVQAKEGLGTRDDNRFLRLWHEVSVSRIGFDCNNTSDASLSRKKWFPCNKGGSFRKWHGNREYVVNWENDGHEIKSFRDSSGRLKSRPQNQDFYFRPCLSWSDITSGSLAFRLFERGFINNDASMAAFEADGVSLIELASYCNTPVFTSLSRVANPTMHFKTGNFLSLPYLYGMQKAAANRVSANVSPLVQIAKQDWNAYERSWDFEGLPILASTDNRDASLNARYISWTKAGLEAVNATKQLEEENNAIFIEHYGLGNELSPVVPIEEITLSVNPFYRYGDGLEENAKWLRFRRDTNSELISYGIGCMMGRYSLDQLGLILADSRDSQAAQLAAYEAKVGKPLSEVLFKPDPDGIIPVLDGEWFEDDIVARTREFLAVTFPESSVAENLRFIEESLGKDIRKYFCSEFYKDHLQTYKKRPIYWMVQSPRKGFACLIYLHRYTKDTLNQVLNNYFRPYLQKLDARLAQLGLDQLNDDLPARERTAARKEAEKITKVLKECQAWEQDALLPLAQQRIELDLDDGVKANYLKLQDVLAPIPGLAAKED